MGDSRTAEGFSSITGYRWVSDQLVHFHGGLEVKVASWLARHFDQSLICWASLRRCGKELGCDVRSIRRVARQLEARGLLKVISPDEIIDPETRCRYDRIAHQRVNIYRGLVSEGRTVSSPSRGPVCPHGEDQTVPERGTWASSKEYTEDYTEEDNEKDKGQSPARESAPVSSRAATPPPAQPEVDLPQVQDCVTAPEGQDEPPPRQQATPEPEPFELRAPPKLTPKAMQGIYNEAVKGSPLVRCFDLTETRRRRLQAIAKSPCRDDPQAWERVCRFIGNDPFHRGERNGDGHKHWVASIDYLLRGDHTLQILEKIETAIRNREQEIKDQGLYYQADYAPPPLPEEFVRARSRHAAE